MFVQSPATFDWEHPMLCLIFFFFPSESVWAAAPPGVPLLLCCLPAAEDKATPHHRGVWGFHDKNRGGD
jgi:hypothetical protein